LSFSPTSSPTPLPLEPTGRQIPVDVAQQRTENGQIGAFDLVRQTPKFREEQFRELFRNKTEEKKG